MPDESEEKNKIKVTDRRLFTPEGDLRSTDETVPPQADGKEPVRGETFEIHSEASDRQPSAGEAQGVDFNSFVLSLSSTAFIHLGEMEDPSTGKKEVSLEGARQMIDILDMLRDKTRGNLGPEEKQLLDGVLYELKMRFTQRASEAG